MKSKTVVGLIEDAGLSATKIRATVQHEYDIFERRRKELAAMPAKERAEHKDVTTEPAIGDLVEVAFTALTTSEKAALCKSVLNAFLS